MRLPSGCGDMSGKLVRLTRSLYCRKRSGRQWAGILLETAVDYGTEPCRTDQTCVRPMVADGKVELIIALHVNDWWLQY